MVYEWDIIEYFSNVFDKIIDMEMMRVKEINKND